uniref:Uncharacterized protein LOC108050385 n=1 Tax=Drosophila rhopaloa TaxID=1041015 RepID=A0A6P4FBM8_DRORH
MALENNENNEDTTNGAIPTEDNEMTAYLEKCLLKLRAENAQKAAEIADMKEQMKMLQAEKYATLISIIHSRNVVPNIEVLKDKNQLLLNTLNQFCIQKNSVDKAYADYCKSVLKGKEALKQKSPFDEFTVMPYHELKKHIENIKKDVEEINANTSLIAEELKTEKKWFNLTQKSLVNEIRVLTHIERDAM